jgi:hypothetical protein
MDHIKKIIEREIEDLTIEERHQFRGVVLNTFSSLYDNINNRMNMFESKILDSNIIHIKNLNIINMIVPKDEFYLYEENFSPVVQSSIDENDLIKILTGADKVYKSVIFNGAKSEEEEVKNLQINGILHLNGEELKFALKLEKDETYKNKIKELYSIFSLNSLKWHTVNMPYVDRVYKVIITSYDANTLEKIQAVNFNEDIGNIEIEDSKYKKYFLENYITMWNITSKKFFGNGTIEPTYDVIHYEHTLNFTELKDSFLKPVDGINVYSLEKFSEGVRIETDTNKIMNWEFIDISDVREIEYERKLKYPVFSNAVDMLFINKLRLNNDTRIRTLTEIQRITRSYKNIKERLELKKVEISSDERECFKHEDLNYFIVDEFKLKEQPRKMYLYFNIIKTDEYLEEELDFIISVLQVYFPEYLCKGVILP